MKKIGVLILLFWLCFPKVCHAESDVEQEQIQENLFSQFEFQEIEEFLDEMFPEKSTGFLDLIRQFISGEKPFSPEAMIDACKDQFFGAVKSTKTGIVNILALVIIAALFHNFAGVFKENQVSEIGFFVLYMLLITICLNTFRGLVDVSISGLGNLLAFLKLLSPVYVLAVAIATGNVTSIAFYQMILILICVIELIIQSALIPLTQVYMMIRILNDLTNEQYLSKFGELIHTIIVWSLRALLGGVIGINLIQGMLGPAIDSVKRSVLTRGGEAIPVIGDFLGGTAEVVLGTAVLIKNGIGAVGMVICVGICMSPVMQMVAVTLMYKLTAALVQPISDKRIVGCISSMADGAEILLRILFVSGVLFLITIAMVATTTS